MPLVSGGQKKEVSSASGGRMRWEKIASGKRTIVAVQLDQPNRGGRENPRRLCRNIISGATEATIVVRILTLKMGEVKNFVKEAVAKNTPAAGQPACGLRQGPREPLFGVIFRGAAQFLRAN